MSFHWADHVVQGAREGAAVPWRARFTEGPAKSLKCLANSLQTGRRSWIMLLTEVFVNYLSWLMLKAWISIWLLQRFFQPMLVPNPSPTAYSTGDEKQFAPPENMV